ncbi:MAG: efflux RND transporter permease subunit [Proteobacteria bacterium]|nr:MAG: efflux RND transporter permease subunit [Pseudomonadota bacterium]
MRNSSIELEWRIVWRSTSAVVNESGHGVVMYCIIKILNFEALNVGGIEIKSKMITLDDTIPSINRVNRQRAISVYGNLAPGKSQSVVLDRAKAIAGEILPTGYSFALEGASAGFSTAFTSLYSAMMIGILIAYLILAVQFNSFVHPIPVLIALPFSVTGALIALWAFDASLNLFSFIGLIVLMGISKKNSIMLVEFTNQVRKAGNKPVRESLLEACPVRLRPIIMTSVATVAAALPLVIGGGIGSETRLPLGLSIVGGTIVSTLPGVRVLMKERRWLGPSIVKVLKRRRR